MRFSLLAFHKAYGKVVRNKMSLETVWRWSQGKMFMMMLSSLKLIPFEKKFTETWYHVKNDGSAVETGTFRVEGWLSSLPPMRNKSSISRLTRDRSIFPPASQTHCRRAA
ncbi:MAG: BsuPI-related putative proteinase inhibitor [Nitrospinota bacterium]